MPPDFFAGLEADASLDRALLLKRNGRMLAAWSRASVAWDVVAIMAATLLGSVETMLETLGSPSPRSVALTAGGHRILLHTVEPREVLLLVAKDAVPEAHLREVAGRLLAKIEALSAASSRQVTLGPSVHEPRGVPGRAGRVESRPKNP